MVYSRFELDVLDYLKTHKRALIPGDLLIKRLLEEEFLNTKKREVDPIDWTGEGVP
jgi:hypothetical protein